MLYATTRNQFDTYTNILAQRQDRAPDGGLFVPMSLPEFSDAELRRMARLKPSDVLAAVLSRFFSTRITGRDVEFTIDYSFYRLTDISHRITVAELWRNPKGDFDGVVRALARRIGAGQEVSQPSEWMGIAVRIGMLFAVFSELMAQGLVSPVRPMDVAVPTGDFADPMAVRYAKQMGLPVRQIVCCSDEDTNIWDSLRRGHLRIRKESVPSIPRSLERFLDWALSPEEMLQFQQVLEEGGVFLVSADQNRRLCRGLATSVISHQRIRAAIANVYRTHGLLLDRQAAMVYCGLQDYRCINGQSGQILMLGGKNPTADPVVMEMMGLDRQGLWALVE